MKKLSRREILEAGVFGSIAISGARASRLSSALGEAGTQDRNSTASVFNGHERDLLRVAMDEIIPATDGMPAASEAGSAAYIENLAGHDAKLAKELQEGLAVLEALSQKRFQTSFASLSHPQRVEALTELDRKNAETFKVLRDAVYEAYYEQPQVWKLIGYEYYSTNGGGPTPEPFDEKILSEVRKKPRHYREA